MFCMFTCTAEGELGLFLIGLQVPPVSTERNRVIGCHTVLPPVADSICGYNGCSAISLLGRKLLMVLFKCPHLSKQGLSYVKIIIMIK